MNIHFLKGAIIDATHTAKAGDEVDVTPALALQFIAQGIAYSREAAPLPFAPPVLVSSVTLSPAQLKNLVAAPVIILPAPGPGKLLLVQSLLFRLSFGTAAYVDNDGVNFADPELYLGAQELNTNGTWPYYFNLSSAVDHVITAGADSAVVAAAKTDSTDTWLISSFANQPLRFGNASSPAFDYTTGDGTLTITAFYSIVELG